MIITIGAFDGFHKGHAELLKLCRKVADGQDWGVVSFYPHPEQFMNTLTSTLFTLRERELIRRCLGIPNMFVLSFNDELRRLPPQKFWRLLREKFSVDGLVMGSDFHFGMNRAGSAESLSRLAKDDGLTKVFTLPLLEKSEYSSSRVRECFSAGRAKECEGILGYPCFLMGKVLHGKGRGRTMSYPTANIDVKGRIVPQDGVYASAVFVRGGWYCGAVSVGKNPTFGDVNEVRCEVHILDFSGDIYGEEVPVFFLERVRGIETFAGIDELRARIALDAEECRRIYGMMEGHSFFKRVQEVLSTGEITTKIVRLTQ